MTSAWGTTSDAIDTEERRKRTRVHSKYILPSNRHSFLAHFDILKRFVNLTRSGVDGVEASKVEREGVPVQAASMNVRFMRSIGLLTPSERGKYVPTQEAIRFVNARSVGDDRARPIMNALISGSWFAELARPAVGSR